MIKPEPKTFQGRLYYCGYSLLPYMFPDYEFMGYTEWITKGANSTNLSQENDILVVGMFGRKCNYGKGDEKTSFAGKILYVNGEPHGDPVKKAWEEQQNYSIEKIYQMGSYPKKSSKGIAFAKDYERYREQHSLQVYHAAMNFLVHIYPKTTSDDNFDPWKQITEGGGDNRSDDRPRIPAIVYVSRNCVGYRQKMAALLAKSFEDIAVSFPKAFTQAAETSASNMIVSSSFLHYGGKCHVEGGMPVPPDILEGWENEKRNSFRSNYKTIYTRYKYCLVMENTKKDGYVTEKLVHGLLGGCLPIYYGSKDVYNIFREDAFVYMDPKNPEPALREIRSLEENHTEYLRRTNRTLPLLKVPTETTVDDYFSLLPTIGTGKLCRKLHEMMSLPIPASLATKN